MNHSDFRIGMQFFMGGKPWRVTDVGTRTVVAILLDDTDYHGRPLPASWFVGPPYAVPETVIDEHDMRACAVDLSPEDAAYYREMGDALKATRGNPTDLP